MALHLFLRWAPWTALQASVARAHLLPFGALLVKRQYMFCLHDFLSREPHSVRPACACTPATRARAGRASSFAPIAALGRLILISLLILTLKSTEVRVLPLRRSLPRGWLQYLVNEAVSHGLVRRQIEISLHVLPTLLGRLTGHLGQLHVEIVVHLLHVLYLQRNVGCLSLEGTFHTNPLEEETRIRQGAATALGTSASEKGAHARAQSNVDGGNLAVLADLAKEIVDSQSRAEEGAGNVEVQGDGTSGILLPQVQDGRND